MPSTTDLDALLESYVARVEESRHNLVSRRAREELRDRHLPECVAFARMLPRGPATLLDVGSGGGFPGFVVAVMRPDLDVVLLDATQKKVAFLQETARELDVAVEAIHGRAEELQRGPLGGRFDLVTARAVAPLDRLVGWTVPFLRPGGLVYAVKGERWREEVDAAAGALRAAGASIVATPDEVGDDEDPTAPLVVIIRRAPEDGGTNTEGNP